MKISIEIGNFCWFSQKNNYKYFILCSKYIKILIRVRDQQAYRLVVIFIKKKIFFYLNFLFCFAYIVCDTFRKFEEMPHKIIVIHFT